MAFGIDDAAIIAAIQGGSSLIGGLMGQSGQAATNAASSREAETNRQWMEHMSNTAYVRAMEDMRHAGLNPILAGSLGGASTPSGVMPNFGNPGASMQQAMEGIGHSAASVFEHRAKIEQAAKDTTQQQLNKASENLQHQLASKAEADTITSGFQAQNYQAQTRNLDANTLNADVTNATLKHGVNTARSEAEIRAIEAEYARKWGPGSWGQQGGTLERILQRFLNPPVGSAPPTPTTGGWARPSWMPPAPSPEREAEGRRLRGN